MQFDCSLGNRQQIFTLSVTEGNGSAGGKGAAPYQTSDVPDWNPTR